MDAYEKQITTAIGDNRKLILDIIIALRGVLPPEKYTELDRQVQYIFTKEKGIV